MQLKERTDMIILGNKMKWLFNVAQQTPCGLLHSCLRPAEGAFESLFLHPVVHWMAWLYVKRQGRDTQCLLLLSVQEWLFSCTQSAWGGNSLHTACIFLTALFFYWGVDCLRKGFFFLCEDCSRHSEENSISTRLFRRRRLAGKVFCEFDASTANH